MILAGAAALACAGSALRAAEADWRSHWAFQNVQAPAAPSVPEGARVQQPLDAFVIARLAAKNLTLSAAADRPTLIRRAYFNLVGVPPTAEEIDAFVADADPQAFAKLVDRLLADPRFGERWARYWLDVARYADSKGYVFQEERRYAYSYTFRDWVIRSFNEDLPYDQFLLAQLAGDQSLGKDDPRHLAAMGFLTLGRRFLNNEPDIIDDRIDVTFRGLQGLTVGCARCHDHKSDPVPAADYYSLYGVFASSEEPKEKPLLGEPERTPEYLAFEAELNKREQAVVDFHVQKKRALFQEGSLQQYLQACADGWEKPDGELAALAKERKIYPSVVLRWREHLRKLGDRHPVTAPWLALVKVPAEKFAAEREAVLVQLASTTALNPLISEPMKATPPSSMADVCKLYAQVLAKYPDDQPMPDANAEAMRLVLKSPDGPEGVDAMGLARDFSVPERDEARRLRNEVEGYKATAENGPPRAMAMVDRGQPVEPRIFKRGNRNMPGDQVPRQFLACLSGPERKPFQQGSGRLELAQLIASKENPLTARVMVNRTWGWLTGQPLVDTPSDFGVRTPPPANPELLDHLAARFMEQGWSVKKLIREILLSATWQQVDDVRAEAVAADPENRLMWRMNRRRRDFESFRDTLLSVAGRLDAKVGGRAVNLDDAEANRRTIYGFIDRQNLPALFRAFDFASPDQHAPKRFQTTVPQQALFALNNPFVLRQARALAETPAPTAAERLTALHRRVLGRAPTPDELQAGLDFVQSAPVGQTAGAWEYGWGDVDEHGRTRFHRLPFFGKDRWSGSADMPDAALQWVMWTRGGGHTGADRAHGAILRWTAPEAGRVDYRGELKRPSEAGDGVRATLVSSLRGVLGTWDVPPKGAVMVAADGVEVAEGETLDVVVDCKEGDNSDSFQFAPRIVQTGNGQLLAASDDEFAGPALDPWVAYAQVLLVGNELMFVD